MRKLSEIISDMKISPAQRRTRSREKPIAEEFNGVRLRNHAGYISGRSSCLVTSPLVADSIGKTFTAEIGLFPVNHWETIDCVTPIPLANLPCEMPCSFKYSDSVIPETLALLILVVNSTADC